MMLTFLSGTIQILPNSLIINRAINDLFIFEWFPWYEFGTLKNLTGFIVPGWYADGNRLFCRMDFPQCANIKKSAITANATGFTKITIKPPPDYGFTSDIVLNKNCGGIRQRATNPIGTTNNNDDNNNNNDDNNNNNNDDNNNNNNDNNNNNNDDDNDKDKPAPKKNNNGVVIGIVIGVLALLVLGVGIGIAIYLSIKKKREKEQKPVEENKSNDNQEEKTPIT